MTSQDESDAIRADIDQTRAELSYNVDTLAETANPKNVVGREVNKLKGAARNARDQLFGAPDDPVDSGTVGRAADAVTDAAADKTADLRDRAAHAAETVSEAPEQLLGMARAKPLAAGLIAFAVGYLISSAVPSTRPERRAALQLQNSAPLNKSAQAGAHKLQDRLRDPAHDALESMKATIGGAVETVKQESKSAAEHVKGQTDSAAETIRGDHPESW